MDWHQLCNDVWLLCDTWWVRGVTRTPNSVPLHCHVIRTHSDRHKMTAILQAIFSNPFSWKKNRCILIQISLKFVIRGLINKKPALVQIMVWHRRQIIIWIDYCQDEFSLRVIFTNSLALGPNPTLALASGTQRNEIRLNSNQNTRISSTHLEIPSVKERPFCSALDELPYWPLNDMVVMLNVWISYTL